jgi:signal transduction histidine kinase
MQPDKLFSRYCELQRYIDWTDEDADRVRSLAPIAERHFANLIDDFYAAIQQTPATMKVITGGSEQIQRLKGTLIGWLKDLFSGRYDQDYVFRRWKVGQRHVDIGLDQVYTNAALSRLRQGLLLQLENEWLKHQPLGDTRSVLAARRSLNKLLDLDLAIIEDAYQSAFLARQSRTERLAVIGQVAGGIAHEIRNPLNVIKTSIYYLRTAGNVSPEKVSTHLERIERQTVLADKIVTALHDFARLPMPRLQAVPVPKFIKEVVSESLLPEHVRVSVNCPPDVPAVSADPEQLRIVFSNLIRNASDAMPAGGSLNVQSMASDNQVVFVVSDTGVGIDAKNLRRIMEPFHSTKARGLGLGLAIARAIVDKHNGHIHVASQLGTGTTVTITLPMVSDP